MASSTEQKAEANQLKTIDMNEHIKKHWNAMAKWYSGLANRLMAPTTAALIPHLQLNSKNDDGVFKLLDVAVGDGFNSVQIILELISCKSSGFEYHGIDIAPEMVKICNETIYNNILISTFLRHNDSDNNKYKINVSAQNGEDLSNFKANTFDRYFSSLCLMITHDAKKMIQSAFNVLKPNGISAWSIWGFNDTQTFFELIAAVLKPIKKELGIETVNTRYKTRSISYLADDIQNTMKLFESIGFKRVFYFSLNNALPINTAKQWSDYYSKAPNFVGLLNKCKDDEERKKIRKMLQDGLNKQFKEIVIQQNKAIIHNTVCIIAIK